MTEHKYTDEEVIRALKSCREKDCGDCPMCEYPRSICEWNTLDFALDLINRQREEIAVIKETTAEIRYEAIKEFAERLKTYYRHLGRTAGGLVEYHIDEVVKEMTSSDAPKVVHRDYFTPKEGVNNE